MEEKQYYIFNETSGNYVSTNYYIEQPSNSTEIVPEVNTDFAKWDGVQWIDNRTPEQRLKSQVPESVTRRQLKIQLMIVGIEMAAIDSVIDQLPEPGKSFARIGWNDAYEFDRNNPLLIQLAIALGKSDSEVDQIFIDAKLL